MDKELTTITAPTLKELMNKLEAATPTGKIAVVKESSIINEGLINKDGLWTVIYTLKDRV